MAYERPLSCPITARRMRLDAPVRWMVFGRPVPEKVGRAEDGRVLSSA